jgi:hypothetical protein
MPCLASVSPSFCYCSASHVIQIVNEPIVKLVRPVGDFQTHGQTVVSIPGDLLCGSACGTTVHHRVGKATDTIEPHTDVRSIR